MKVFKFGYTDSALVLLGHGRKMSLTSGARLAATREGGGTPGWARRGMGRLAGQRERKEKKKGRKGRVGLGRKQGRGRKVLK